MRTNVTADPWLELGDDVAIDFAALTPIQIESGLTSHLSKMSRVKSLLIGGAALHPRLENQLHDLKNSVYHSYAMTETLTHVALRAVTGSKGSDVYKALDGVSFGVNEQNCLIINDAQLGLTNLQTTDEVELLDSKSFRWLGRMDNVINSGGIKIHVEQLESLIGEVLSRYGIITRFCIITRDDIRLTTAMLLLIEENVVGVEALEIRNYLKKNLPRFHSPTEVLLVPEIFHTESGKLDRIKNASHYLHP